MPLEIRKGSELQERYVISDLLGSGGFAIIWKATDKRLGRDVAIKRLLRIKGNELEALLTEARNTAQLNHTNIVQLYDTFVQDDEGFLVMEYVDGETLDKFCLRLIAARQWLAVSDASEYFEQILKALAFAHSRGIFHRDIKPTNILVSKLGVIKLVDFGIARPIVQIEYPPSRPYESGAALTGTPQYMSPEQARGEPLNQQTDIFSGGLVGYLLFTGRHPFAHPSALQSPFELIRSESVECEDPRQFSPQVPERTAKVLLRMLKKGRTVRYQGITDALADFRPRIEMVPCPRCASPNPEANKFCGECGQELVARRVAGQAPTAQALTDEGFELAQKDDWAGAVGKYREAIKLDPKYSRAQANLGYALNRLGSYEEAIEILDRAIPLAESKPEDRFLLHGMHDSRGFAKSNLKKYSEALDDFNRSLNLNARNPRVLCHRAETLLFLDEPRYTEAYTDVLMALKIDPESPRANRIKRRLEEQGLVEPIGR